jgi:hypothetical protein
MVSRLVKDDNMESSTNNARYGMRNRIRRARSKKTAVKTGMQEKMQYQAKSKEDRGKNITKIKIR